MDFIQFLKFEKNSRKIFGKRELKIIEKQLLGIKLTQSERNRLSRDIREKLKFIKEVIPFLNEFDLRYGSYIKKILNESKATIINCDKLNLIDEIILYGSTLNNNRNFNSDIDLALKCKKLTLKEATLLRKRLSGQLDSRVDVHIYDYLPINIRREIDLNGRIIYKK